MYDDTAVTLQETLADTENLHPEDAYMQISMHTDLRNALNSLPDRDRQVLHLCYGFNDHEPSTYQHIGNKLGISRERVRQLKEDALNRLRHPTHRKRLAAYCS